MTQAALTAAQLPRTMAEFADWEPNDGEMIKFIGVQQQQWYVYEILNGHFILKIITN
jgi:hypothetical protein